jgi:hypothetical protein
MKIFFYHTDYNKENQFYLLFGQGVEIRLLTLGEEHRVRVFQGLQHTNVLCEFNAQTIRIHNKIPSYEMIWYCIGKVSMLMLILD